MAATKVNYSTTDLQIRRARRAKGKPFMGVDGEGCGHDRHGRQHYMLLRAGPYECFTGKPLNTFDCLDFILSLPDTHILVGFSFGYDVTQILRDLPAERLARIFADKQHGTEGRSRYTYWNRYAIEYLPRNYLRVSRLLRNEEGNWYRDTESTRTIWEVFGNFQTSFLKTLQAYDIGKRFWDDIDLNKRKRSKFARITKGIRRYCELECLLLAALMEKFRNQAHAAGIHPNQWAGAGKLAAYLHRANQTITQKELLDKLNPGLLALASGAYYGGRFEITRIGDIPACTEADINSAYPDAMRSLPCLKHGTWQRVTSLWLRNAPADALYVADVKFRHPEGMPLHGLPVRSKEGFLYWPREGQGFYWSPEIRSAERLGARIEPLYGWRYIPHCQCQPFAWVDALYQERLRCEKINPGSGQPIKLGINSLYGKLAQRIGSPTYGNFIWAGLITALTRAKLNDAIALDPEAIVMIATDAVVSLRPLALSYGKGLGQWDRKDHARLFVVQPGLYWSGRRRGDKRKTRGTSLSMFARHMHRFEKAWRTWCATRPETCEPQWYDDPAKGRVWRRPVPAVTLNLTLFIGLRLAHARGALVTAGQWARTPREFSFEWGRKRQLWPVIWEGPSTARTTPLAGGPDHVSVTHKANMDRVREMELQRMLYQDQPEYVDRSMPGSEREWQGTDE